jgi:hypothetical protein
MKRVVIVSGELTLAKSPVEFVGLIISETGYLPKPWEYSAAAESRHLQESGVDSISSVDACQADTCLIEEEIINRSFACIAWPVHA